MLRKAYMYINDKGMLLKPDSPLFPVVSASPKMPQIAIQTFRGLF